MNVYENNNSRANAFSSFVCSQTLLAVIVFEEKPVWEKASDFKVNLFILSYFVVLFGRKPQLACFWWRPHVKMAISRCGRYQNVMFL